MEHEWAEGQYVNAVRKLSVTIPKTALGKVKRVDRSHGQILLLVSFWSGPGTTVGLYRNCTLDEVQFNEGYTKLMGIES